MQLPTHYVSLLPDKQKVAVMDDKKQALASFGFTMVVDSDQAGAVVDRKQAIASSCDGKEASKTNADKKDKAVKADK
eukprot:12575118-Ditylum_brightwellii.AAC.1